MKFAYRSYFFPAFFCILAALSSCTKPDVTLSPDKAIVSFTLLKPDGSGFDLTDITVTLTRDTIYVVLPPGTSVNGLIPDISFTGISITPATEAPQDFSEPVTYTITAQDGSTATYVVVVSFSNPAATNNLMYIGCSDNNFYALNAQTGVAVWKYAGEGWFSYATPVLYNGVVYAGCTDNNVYAFDAATGVVRWKYSTGEPIESSLAVADGVVYAGSDNDKLYALDAATGNEIWTYGTGANVSSRPAILDGTVFFGSSDNNVYALDAKDGSLKWKFAAQAAINQSGVSVSNGVAFVGSRDGNLYAINAATGILKWSYNTGGISLEQSTPFVSNGIVYIGGWYDISDFTKAGSVYAVDEATGTLLWTSLNHLGFSCNPYVADHILYMSADDGNFYALNASDGNILWQKPILPNGAGANTANSIVYVGGCGTHYIYAFNAATGNVVWQYHLNTNALSSSSPCINGTH